MKGGLGDWGWPKKKEKACYRAGGRWGGVRKIYRQRGGKVLREEKKISTRDQAGSK